MPHFASMYGDCIAINIAIVLQKTRTQDRRLDLNLFTLLTITGLVPHAEYDVSVTSVPLVGGKVEGYVSDEKRTVVIMPEDGEFFCRFVRQPGANCSKPRLALTSD